MGPGRSGLRVLQALAGFGGRGYRGGLLTTGLIGAGMIGAGKGVDAIADTPWGREQAPVTRAMMGLGSAGLTVSGYLAIGRGALGSAHAAFDRGATWNSNRLRNLAFQKGVPMGSFLDEGLMDMGRVHKWDRTVGAVDRGFAGAKRTLGGPLYGGSPLNRMIFSQGDRASPLARGVWGATKAVVKTPFRIATGMVDVAAQGVPNAARFMFGGMAGRSVGSILAPRSLFASVPGANLFLNNGRAAMGSGMFGWAAGASVAAQYINAKGNAQSGWQGSSNQFNPNNYGQGFYSMRRGQANNYGPALTLMLHRNSGRVMP